MKMTRFKNRVPTFTSDDPGNYDYMVDKFIIDPFFRIPFGPRDILEFRLEHFVITWTWKLMVLEPPIPNLWQFCDLGNVLLRDLTQTSLPSNQILN
jgi:hypothetical protein